MRFVTAVFLIMVLLLGFIAATGFDSDKRTSGSWSLGVDQPVTYSEDFSVTGGLNQVKITGWQDHTANTPIRYSVVRMNAAGIPVDYGSFEMKGNIPMNGKPFEHLFTNLPPGSGYRLEIYNYGACLCIGGVKVTTWTTF